MSNLSAIFKKYLYWLVLGLFVLIPLYPKFPLFNVPGTYVAIRLEDLVITVVSIWWLIAVLPEIKGILTKTLTQSMIIFWAIGLLSLFSGIFLTSSVIPYLGFLHYLRRVETMILLFIALSAFQSLKQVKLWLACMIVATLIVVIYGFGQQLLNFPVISTSNREFSKGLILYLTPDARVNSTFAGHYDLAAYLAVFLTIAASMWVYFSSILKKVLISVVSILSFVMLSMTAARVSFGAAILGITSVLWLVGQKKLILGLGVLVLIAFIISPELRHRTVATITVNFLGGGGPKYQAPPQRVETLESTSSGNVKFSVENAATGAATPSGVPIDIAPGEPINSTELGVYRSFGIRFNEEWPRAIRAFEKNPLLGTGYSSITIATDNDYLRSLGETGLLGTSALILVWLVILKKFWVYLKIKRKSLGFYLIVGLLSAGLAMLVNGTFIDVFESSKISQLFWLSLGVGLAVIEMDEDKT